jgi:O-antigen ligase
MTRLGLARPAPVDRLFCLLRVVRDRNGYQRAVALLFGVLCAGFSAWPGEWPERWFFYASLPLTLPAVASVARRLRPGPLHWVLAAFLAYSGISALWSAQPMSAAQAIPKSFWIGYLLLLCCAVGEGGPARWRQVFTAVAGFAAVFAVFALADFAWTCTECARYVGFGRHANSNYTASVTGATAVLGLAAALLGRDAHVRDGSQRLWPHLLTQPPLCALLVATGSRAALLAYLGLAVLAIVLVSRRVGHWHAARAAVATTMGLAVAASAAIWLAYGWVQAEVGRGDTFRLQIWRSNLHQIAQHPWFGHGSTAPTSSRWAATSSATTPITCSWRRRSMAEQSARCCGWRCSC